ncbi:hypothetical protein GCM10007924_12570 [Sneathiella chinensis]|uniref:Uncharacterized protein n=1 Tax=Sneathiella chinensis TaxID=349750 RepID=A0ABQ5U3Q7_9PROT|nr:hypothetical protein GCM10007924_12570 [Sneathiella chinensis]
MEKAAGVGADPQQVGFSDPRLQEAGRVFRQQREEYPDHVDRTFNKLTALLAVCENFESRRAMTAGQIRDIANGLSRQGVQFGYPLLSAIADSLAQYCDATAGQSDRHLRVVSAHVDAMRAVVTRNLSGDGGAVGQALMGALSGAIRKF